MLEPLTHPHRGRSSLLLGNSLVFLAAVTACGGAAAPSTDTVAGGAAGAVGTGGTTLGGATSGTGSSAVPGLGGGTQSAVSTTGGATNPGGGGGSLAGGAASGGRVASDGGAHLGGNLSSVGGAAAGGVLNTGGITTGGFATSLGGKTAAAGAVSTGGIGVAGNTTSVGGKAGVGGTSAGGSGCADIADAAPIPSCSNDSQCPTGQFCDTRSCGSSCSCVGGEMHCTNVCVYHCAPIACTPAGTAFRSQFTAVNCDVVARVNSDATEVLGYRVVCGNAQTVTVESLKAKLLPMSRVNWSQASSYGSASDAAYLFVHASNPYDVVAFGISTGLQLVEFTDSMTTPMFGTWSPASDIDGSCYGPSPVFQSLGPWDASYPGQAALNLVYKKGLIAGVNSAFGGYRAISVVRASLVPVEYLVIVSSFVHV